MAFGPGKYDDLAMELIERTAAEHVVLVVVGGKHGDGVSQKFHLPESMASASIAAEQMMKMATALRAIADGMQADARRLRQQARGN